MVDRLQRRDDSECVNRAPTLLGVAALLVMLLEAWPSDRTVPAGVLGAVFVAWTVVGIPLVYGVYETIVKVKELF